MALPDEQHDGAGTVNEPRQRTAEDIAAELALIDDARERDAGDDAAPRRQTSSDAPDYEAIAMRRGWRPKEEWQGDPAKWVDAQSFVERGERFLKNVERDRDELKRKLDKQTGLNKRMVEMYEERLTQKNNELKDVVSRLRAQRSQAQAEGDHDLAAELDDRIDSTKEAQAKAAKDLQDFKKEQEEGAAAPDRQPGPNMDDPVINDWIEDGNEWFREDPKLQQYAVALGEQLIKEGETVRGRRFLDKIRSIMEVEFPRRFAAKGGNTGTVRNTGAEGTGGSNGRASSKSRYSERDLPQADLDIMRELVASGATTREKFLASYFSDLDNAGRRSHR